MYGKTNLYGGVRRGNSRQMKKYTARNGNTVWVDISPEAFRRNGFKNIRHGDRMLDPNEHESIALGFAHNDAYQNIVLWYEIEGWGVVYYHPSRPEDYKKLEGGACTEKQILMVGFGEEIAGR